MNKLIALAAFLALAVGCAAPQAPAPDSEAPEHLVLTTDETPALAVTGSAGLIWLSDIPEAAPSPAVTPKALKRLKEFKVNEKRVAYVIDAPRGMIDDEMAEKFINRLVELDAEDDKKEIQIIIRSRGGYVDAGSRMVAALKATKAPTVCVVDEKAHSMAAMLLQFCDTRYLQEYAGIMFHEAYYGVEGQETHVKSRVQHFDAQWKILKKDVATRVGLDLKAFEDKCEDEWWLTSEEAAANGAADGIVEGLRYKYETPEAPPLPFFFFMNP